MTRAWFTKPRLLALAAGGLPALTFPEPSLWWLAYVCLVPLILVIRSAPSGREAIMRGWWGGTGFIFAVHHWLIPNLYVFLLVVAVAVGALWAPWGWLTWRVLREPRPYAALALVPSAWIAIELVRSLEYLGGPWGLMGASQWQVRPALALASLGGVWLVSALVVAANVAVAAGLAFPEVRGHAVAGVVAIVALMLGWWAVAPGPTETGSARIAVVQPGVVHDPQERFDRGAALTGELAGQDIDVVVWGESSVGFDLDARPDLRDRLGALAAEVGAPVLVNVDARRTGPPGIFKSTVLVAADGSSALQDDKNLQYDKMRLVPFGEYVPLRFLFGWVTGATEAAGEDRRRGDEMAVLDAGGLRLGPLVCFETAFPDMSRGLADRGADVLVFQSSTSTFQQSWAPEQHASLAALRAAETWRPAVHATLTGVSAAYDADGRLVGSLATSERTASVFEIPIVTGTSPYVRFGAWVPVLALAVLAGAAFRMLVARYMRTRSGNGASAPVSAAVSEAEAPLPDREG